VVLSTDLLKELLSKEASHGYDGDKIRTKRWKENMQKEIMVITFCRILSQIDMIRCGLTRKVKFSILSSSKSPFLSNQQLNINLVLREVFDPESLRL
jgi:hypothetical protein